MVKEWLKNNFMFSVLESLYTHTGCVFVDGGVWCVYSNHGTHGTHGTHGKRRPEDAN